MVPVLQLIFFDFCILTFEFSTKFANFGLEK